MKKRFTWLVRRAQLEAERAQSFPVSETKRTGSGKTAGRPTGSSSTATLLLSVHPRSNTTHEKNWCFLYSLAKNIRRNLTLQRQDTEDGLLNVGTCRKELRNVFCSKVVDNLGESLTGCTVPLGCCRKNWAIWLMCTTTYPNTSRVWRKLWNSVWTLTTFFDLYTG